MTFEEWWEVQEELDRNPANEAFAKPVWDAAWDEQQRVIDEMHLQFKDYICPECRSPNFRHKMDCGRGR